MEITPVITKMAAGSNSSVWQDLLLLSRQNEFSDLPAGWLRYLFESPILIERFYLKFKQNVMRTNTCSTVFKCHSLFRDVLIIQTSGPFCP